MKHQKVIWLALLILTSCAKPEPDWNALKSQLDEIGRNDQLYRGAMDSIGVKYGWQSTEMQALWAKQMKLDSSDLAQVEIIISTVGYPPSARVGTSNEAIFYTLQHSPDSIMVKHYDLITKAGDDGELKKSIVALYVDRVLMNKGEPQLYGSQIRMEYKTDFKGQKYDSVFLWKLKDPDHITEMRTKMGLPPLAEYLKHFEIDPAKGYIIKYAPSH